MGKRLHPSGHAQARRLQGDCRGAHVARQELGGRVQPLAGQGAAHPHGRQQKEQEGQWTIHASSLEELVAKQVVGEEKVADFKQVYKDPKEFACVFVIRKIGATFVFLPLK